MDEIVCANTAFRYWRCPPQVRDLYPRLHSSEDGWRALSQAPFVTEVLKTPVITAASTRSNLHSKTRRTIRWNNAYTEKVSIDTGMGFSVTDPLNTLFTMTRSVSSCDLVLAMYEFCGWFSVFKPSPAVDMALERAKSEEEEQYTTESLFELDENQDEAPWKRVYARVHQKDSEHDQSGQRDDGFGNKTNGKGTSLWMRKPLIEIEELHRFAAKVKGEMWGKQFCEAAQQVMGIAASPLEVAGIILLSHPRRAGGAEFKNIFVNDLTPLSNSARKIAGQKICYGDIVIVNPITMKAVIIELQGEVIHGSGAVLDHDATRMTALQSMGYDVFLVTHDMLNDHDQLDAIIHSVCERLELCYKPKTEAMRCAETRLRANVLCNWLGIGK